MTETEEMKDLQSARKIKRNDKLGNKTLYEVLQNSN